jgi:hypothetical protein
MFETPSFGCTVGAVCVTAGGVVTTFSAGLPQNHQASAPSTTKASSGHSQRREPPPPAAARGEAAAGCDRKALTCGGMPVGIFPSGVRKPMTFGTR